MLKAIAIDDEPLALEAIKSLTAHVAFVQIEACFTHSLLALEYLQKHPTDLIFLDIMMPTISGIDFLRAIPKPPMVIFTTAYSEHAVQSFELDAVDYLLKPFSLPRLLKACLKAQEHSEWRKNKAVSPTGQTIFIKSGYEQVRVDLAEIVYAESVGNYVQFVLANREVLSRLTMIEAAEWLPAKDFTRIHRSFIVAVKHIIKMDKKTVWVGKKQLPVGAAYAPDLEKWINKNRKI